MCGPPWCDEQDGHAVGTTISPTVALARELTFNAALSAALVCCPTLPEDETWLNARGLSRATTLLLGGRTPMKRAYLFWSSRFAFAAGNPTLL